MAFRSSASTSADTSSGTSSGTRPAAVTAPMAAKQPKVLEIHGDRRVDDYYWMRDRDNPEVIDYLTAENAYTKAQMQHTEALQQQLYDEMLGRIQETDLSVPYRYGDYWYYRRTEEGKAYGILCRKQGSLDAPETILLDQNELAEGKEFFALGAYEVSPNHQLLAYATDTDGSERYNLSIKDLGQTGLGQTDLGQTAAAGETFDEQIPDVGDVAWASDNRTLFYTRLDAAHRPYQLWRHQLGHDPKTDTLIYEETDDAFFLDISTSRSEAYLLLGIHSNITSEVRFLDANQPLGSFQIIAPRQKGMEYDVEHHPGDGSADGMRGDRFYIVHNDNAINFTLAVTPVAQPQREHWQTVIPHREDVLLSGISAFEDHLVIFERQQGLPTIRVQKLSTGEETPLTFPEPTYAVYGGIMAEFKTRTLRFHYTSMITPGSVFDYDMDSHERTLKKEQPVLGDYDRSQYQSEWLMATAPDGTRVPISLVYKKGIPRDGSAALHLTGYGSYGYANSAFFDSNRLSLLDRGVTYAIAHIRGGSELGRKWYEDGKFLHKKNTFTDFIACAEYLIEQRWTRSEQLVIAGGSAGGLLMGAVLNLRPELFFGAIADVPFVDVVTTILDPDLPLSVTEWDEWGNPNEAEFYHYMKSYSPYDNVQAQDYPHLLITGGLNDPRVSYWEPAKWAAKLRDRKTGSHRLLLKTNMDAGHGGASGRYGALKEKAFKYAFVLDCLGLAEA